MTKRIWELDALRGLFILLMTGVHLCYDLENFFGAAVFEISGPFRLLMDWGGVAFVLLSGCCAVLGRHPVRRGFQVLCCGLLVSAVTVGLAFAGLGEGIAVYFGVLHCLGCCMILWAVLGKLPRRGLAALSIAVILGGLWLKGRSFPFPWLLPLGLMPRNFVTADYFPLLPHLGFFLLGAVLGEKLYRQRRSLLPGIPEKNGAIRFLRFCGRHSLMIYLLHQPVITGLLWLLTVFRFPGGTL